MRNRLEGENKVGFEESNEDFKVNKLEVVDLKIEEMEGVVMELIYEIFDKEEMKRVESKEIVLLVYEDFI